MNQLHIHLTVDPAADFAAIAGKVEANLIDAVLAHGCRRPIVSVGPGLPSRPTIVKRRRVQRERG